MLRLTLVLLSFALSLFPSLSQAACNGHDELCSRKYSNISQIGTHDSAFVGDFLTQNQHLSVASQLNRGIRFLQAQSHDWDSTVKLCHTSCLEEDAGPLSDYLRTIKTFLDAPNNTHEVVTLLLTNPDAIPITTYDSIFKSVGLDTYTFRPASPTKNLALSDWPTLQQLIDSNSRLIVFMDYHAAPTTVPYILDEFAYFFETPFENTDDSWPTCTLDRPGGSSPDGKMYIMNHFLQIEILGIFIPDSSAAEDTNSAATIGGQAQICEGNYARAPKVVLVDYFEKGDVFTAERALNRISSAKLKAKREERGMKGR